MAAKRKVTKSRTTKAARTVVLPIRLTPEEHATVKAAAGPYPVSTWVRIAVAEAARAEVKRRKKGGA